MIRCCLVGPFGGGGGVVQRLVLLDPTPSANFKMLFEADLALIDFMIRFELGLVGSRGTQIRNLGTGVQLGPPSWTSIEL